MQDVSLLILLSAGITCRMSDLKEACSPLTRVEVREPLLREWVLPDLPRVAGEMGSGSGSTLMLRESWADTAGREGGGKRERDANSRH